MGNRVRQALAASAKWMRRHTGPLRELLGVMAVKKERAAEDTHQKAARARFWADFHAGQREAEADCSKREP